MSVEALEQVGERSGWEVTAALARGLVVAAAASATALATGRPVLLVLVAPLVAWSGLALRHRPGIEPVLPPAPRPGALREGQVVALGGTVERAGDVEHVVHGLAPHPRVAMEPRSGRVSGLLAADGRLPALRLQPRRWGRSLLGEELVALNSRWGGFRWWRSTAASTVLTVLPGESAYRSRMAVPEPVGLVGAHRSARPGAGVELADVREFAPGDRLRRIHWRTTTRTGRLHVTTAPAEQDAALLLVVDALADHGRSGGPSGAVSSLDLEVRAAAALARHHVRGGDRVALRILGQPRTTLVAGTGRRHLRRLELALASVVAGDAEPRRARLRVAAPPGTVVVLLSALLDDRVPVVAAGARRRGLAVLVLDCLPAGAHPARPGDDDPRVVDIAWRLRLLERERVRAALEATGCAVVPWRGPGSLDQALRALSGRGRSRA